ncbi:MAG TPA: hypothetical protein VK666_21615 [Chryseolinea sp.]|nr:hypothetical protein [Chryseolinea sp.]
MDDFKIWFYLAVGAVYVLSRLLKKNPANPVAVPEKKRDAKGNPAPVRKEPKPVSFEELLREITASKVPSQPPVVDYDEPLEQEEKDLEDVDYNYRKNEVVTTYEEAKKQAFFRPSLEETMRVGDTVVTYGKFKEFEKGVVTDVAADFLKEFTNMESLKRAVVMSEILKPKF